MIVPKSKIFLAQIYLNKKHIKGVGCKCIDDKNIERVSEMTDKYLCISCPLKLLFLFILLIHVFIIIISG
jgi:hypothetical protein